MEQIFKLAWIGEVSSNNIEELLINGEIPPVEKLKFEDICGEYFEDAVKSLFDDKVDDPIENADYLFAVRYYDGRVVIKHLSYNLVPTIKYYDCYDLKKKD
jgi:hypothetical protein